MKLDGGVSASIANDSLAGAGHRETPFGSLTAVEFAIEPQLVGIDLADATVLLDGANSSELQMLATLPLGGVIEHIDSTILTNCTPQQKRAVLDGVGTISMIVGRRMVKSNHGQVMAVDLVSAHRMGPDGKRARWQTQQEQENGINVKADALGALGAFFDPDRTAETTQMLGHVFGAQQTGELPVAQLGHDSHYDPLRALGDNMLLRIPGVTFSQHTMTLDAKTGAAEAVRVGMDEFGRVVGLPTPMSTYDRVLGLAYATTAVHTASTNPTGYGRGTDAGHVFDAMQQTTLELPQLVGNGANVGAARTLFQRGMSSRSF